ncbi:glycosyltransferase [Parasalinivibrio latis]|uniref:glycosyltransferase n=1 Tax=Parasalinivibrio latis TaxID=2952610 RepID=UPI0030E5B6F0
MRLLTVSTLYPFSGCERHGVFVETRLRQLRQCYPNVEAKVIAPVPWFPFKSSYFGEYAKYAGVPDKEVRHGIEVFHPRYAVIPKVGWQLTPFFLRQAITRKLRELIVDDYIPDLIDGHYFYPDGVAIKHVAGKFRIPFTCTARGTDLNLIPRYSMPQKEIVSVMEASKHNMAVCGALRNAMIEIGGKPEKITVLRNGVDLRLFPFTREEKQRDLRSELGLPKDVTVLLSVGHLTERKGHHLVIDALASLSKAVLVIAGDGEEAASLKQQVIEAGLSERVIFAGALSQQQLARYYGAANALVLASSREGWANVLLEAMACGTPVVATNLWGTPEVVAAPEAGVLVERDAASIARGIQELLSLPPARLATRRYAEQFSWDETSDAQMKIFEAILSGKEINRPVFPGDVKVVS